MVDEGFSISLDWYLNLIIDNPKPDLWYPLDPYGVEKIEEFEDMKVDDDNMETSEKDENKETLITENRGIWN